MTSASRRELFLTDEELDTIGADETRPTHACPDGTCLELEVSIDAMRARCTGEFCARVVGAEIRDQVAPDGTGLPAAASSNS